MNPHLSRANLLIDQDRYELAERELRKALAAEPEDPIALALLAVCLSEQERHGEATGAAQQAVGLGPDIPFTHYALGRVMMERNRFKEAEASLEEAIALDPEEPDFVASLAAVHAARERWRRVLNLTDRALELDPEHVMALNLRSLALVRTGQKVDAEAATDAALAQEPENAFTHANHGWRLLQAGERNKALHHFQEALRLDPEQEWAKAGIVEALKARNILYRVILWYFMWMTTLSPKLRWGLIIGLYVAFRITRGALKSHPEWGPVLWPLVIAYIIFFMMTWIAQPVFNLLLRLNKYGRLALSRDQIHASNLVGACILGVAGFALLAVLTGHNVIGIAALTCWFMIIPSSAVFQCDRGWPRILMVVLLAFIGVCGLAGTGFALLQDAVPEESTLAILSRALSLLLFMAALLAGIAAPWVGNYLMSVTVRK